MKHYWVFAYDNYEECGGTYDFQSDFETFQKAVEYGESLDFDTYQIVDIRNPLRTYIRMTYKYRLESPGYEKTNAAYFNGEWHTHWGRKK